MAASRQISSVVAWWKPRRKKQRRAASMISRRRCSTSSGFSFGTCASQIVRARGTLPLELNPVKGGRLGAVTTELHGLSRCLTLLMKGVVVRQGRAPHSSDGFVPRTFGGFVCGFLFAHLADSL